MSQKLPKELSVVFEKNKDAKTFPVTGAWGGVSPSLSNIVVHLYSEYFSTPNSINAEVNENGQVDINAGQRISRGDVTREIQGTMVITPEIALNLAQWLQEKATEAIRKRGEQNG